MQNFQRGKDNSDTRSHSEVGAAVERPFSWLSGRESTQDGSLAWEDPASLWATNPARPQLVTTTGHQPHSPRRRAEAQLGQQTTN